MRLRPLLIISLLAAAVTQVVSPAGSFAQEFKVGGKRKIVTQGRPVYPALARKLNIIGTVRVLVTVAPEGNVLHCEERGGSPLLVRAALDAVAKTKWAAAEGETTEIVEIRFQPETE